MSDEPKKHRYRAGVSLVMHDGSTWVQSDNGHGYNHRGYHNSSWHGGRGGRHARGGQGGRGGRP